MTHSSIIHQTKCGASVELATINFNGRDFTNLGSVIDEKRGIIYGYPQPDANIKASGEYVLNTWDGQIITTLRQTGTWLNRNTFGGFPVRMYAWSCLYHGRKFHGRNSGTGMLLRLKRS